MTNPAETTVRKKADPVAEEKARSLASDAWDDLRRRPQFWVSAVMIMIMIIMALFPQLFTIFAPQNDPTYADLTMARKPPSADACSAMTCWDAMSTPAPSTVPGPPSWSG